LKDPVPLFLLERLDSEERCMYLRGKENKFDEENLVQLAKWLSAKEEIYGKKSCNGMGVFFWIISKKLSYGIRTFFLNFLVLF
jgi:hypothetical protein